jgi:hypothetical protein
VAKEIAMQPPAHNQVVVFKKVPAGSYCSPGVAYRVDRPRDKGDFRFVNVEGGGSTYDRPWAVRCAEWSAA